MKCSGRLLRMISEVVPVKIISILVCRPAWELAQRYSEQAGSILVLRQPATSLALPRPIPSNSLSNSKQRPVALAYSARPRPAALLVLPDSEAGSGLGRGRLQMTKELAGVLQQFRSELSQQEEVDILLREMLSGSN